MSQQPRDPAGRFARARSNEAINQQLRDAAGFGDVPPEFAALSPNDQLRVLAGVDVPVPEEVAPANNSADPSGSSFGGGQGGIVGGGYKPEVSDADYFNEQIRVAVARSRGEDV